MRLTRKIALVAVTAAASAMLSGRAEAALIQTATFCPGDATCPTGVSASLTVDDNGTPLVNDYLITATFTGTASAPAFLDLFSFTINGVTTPTGYDSVTLQSAPAGVTWATFFDNVSNQVGACTTNTNSSNEVCTNSTNPAIGVSLPNQTRTFTFLVDLAGSLTITSTTGLNLRASFNNADGSNAGILSPGGSTSGGGAGAGGGSGSGQTVPEPATLTLLGLGMLGAAYRARRQA